MGTPAERGKAVYTRFVDDVLNAGDVSVVDDLFAPEYADDAAPPDGLLGRDVVRLLPPALRTAFPDLRVEIEHLVGEGDLLAAHVVARGTHLGPYAGIVAPTGRRVAWASFDMFRVAADGRIVRHWGHADLLDLLQQLGAAPGGPAGTPVPQLAPLVVVPPQQDQDVASNRALVARLYHRVLSDGRLELAAELTGDRFVDHPTARTVISGGGLRVFGERVRELRVAFPDLFVAVDHLVAEGDLVALCMVLTGTHLGPYEGLPATGRRIEVCGVAVHRLRGGRVVERWSALDRLTLLKQLGGAALRRVHASAVVGSPVTTA